MLERVSRVLLLALVASLAFEFRHFPLMSNLQWLFIAISVASALVFVRNWRKLIQDRFFQAALVFILTQWATAFIAGDVSNSLKAAVRVSAGLVLFCAVWLRQDNAAILRVWSFAGIAAAFYGLADYAGYGVSKLFRDAEFYFGDQIRLSGSFEYPTTAAAFYAMSLPIVLRAQLSRPVRVFGCFLLGLVLILTYSRGAAVAAGIALIFGLGMTKRVAALKIATAGGGLFVVIGLLQPLIVMRYGNVKSGRSVAASYELEFNTMKQRPQTLDAMKVTLKNTGAETWRAGGETQVVLSQHWYDTRNKYILPIDPIETVLPNDVASDESITLVANFKTPDLPGVYLLDWDLKRKDKGWFSIEYELTPAVVESHIEESTTPWVGTGDVTRWYDRGPNHVVTLDATVPRPDLWNAALGLIRESPYVGWGPDSYRFLYGPRLGAGKWDTNIRSNSLYLELLVGSGVIGLTAFIAMLFLLRWSSTTASMGVVVFLIHGLVDVLLMTTPIYFGFWILLGVAHENRVCMSGANASPIGRSNQ